MIRLGYAVIVAVVAFFGVSEVFVISVDHAIAADVVGRDVRGLEQVVATAAATIVGLKVWWRR